MNWMDQTEEAYKNGYAAGKKDALALLKEQEKENRALRKLLDWAVECDWGLDNLGDWWVERFSDEIKGMGYTESLIHLARRYIEIFEEGEDDAEVH